MAGNYTRFPTVAGGVLPTGAATAANQVLEIADLDAINAKTPALGQALAAASTPVVLTAAQISTLTPLSTVAATQSGVWNITNVSGTISLPTGASTESTLAALSAKFGSLGQKNMAGSAPVVISSDQSAIAVTMAAVPTGGATAANQATEIASLSSIDTKTPALGQALAAASTPVVLTAAQISTLTPLSTVAATQSGTWTVQPGNTANTTPWLVKESVSATATLSSVASSASSVSLLASNASRLGATFFNDSTTVLYLKFGATASTTSYTVQLAASGYYELPLWHVYTGAIDGIWASANGNCRITELT